jgi:hypothetical protein
MSKTQEAENIEDDGVGRITDAPNTYNLGFEIHIQCFFQRNESIVINF